LGEGKVCEEVTAKRLCGVEVEATATFILYRQSKTLEKLGNLFKKKGRLSIINPTCLRLG
jgi:hypothetical protein